MRSSVSSVAGSASRGMPDDVRMVTVPPTAGSIVYVSFRMSPRTLRTTSRRSAPSKLSTMPEPVDWIAGPGGSVPPGCSPFTTTPLPR